jgi:hypothetical protein
MREKASEQDRDRRPDIRVQPKPQKVQESKPQNGWPARVITDDGRLSDVAMKGDKRP